MKKICVVAGTRPEIIKLAPLLRAMNTAAFPQLQPQFILSGQHREMAAQALDAFSLKADIELDLMREKQAPCEFLANALGALHSQFSKARPDMVVVQGDTATTFAAATAAFHQHIPVAHIEAGLRTHTLTAPFPEEGYRSMISRISSLHFCPTEGAARNLAREGIHEKVVVCGNTVVDALAYIIQQLDKGTLAVHPEVAALLEQLQPNQLVYVSGHRRENLDGPLETLCQALLEFAGKNPSVHLVFPVHLNPAVQSTVRTRLAGVPNIHLLAPLDYVSSLALLREAQLVVSDSGGIQEEVPYCSRFVIVTREDTERPEVLDAGFAELHPPEDVARLVAHIERRLLTTPQIKNSAPFGDGHAAQRILDHIVDSIV